MTTWSHLMIGTIIFGPQPEMVIGTLAVDSFDYLNWITRYFTGRLPLKIVKSNPEKFDRIVDSGFIWEIHQCLNYSLWSFLISLFLSWQFKSIFFSSWAIHVFLDYFSHRNYYLLYPLKFIKIKTALIDYSVNNFKKTLIIDVVLFVIMSLRLLSIFAKTE